ncbi:MAG: TauD/TfdA family dioxygenase [Burkholderiales bacterium]
MSGSSFGIVGMPEDEARDLLDELAAHSTHPKYQMRFKYGVGDVVVWDSASLLPLRDAHRSDDARTLQRGRCARDLGTGRGAVLATTFAGAM